MPVFVLSKAKRKDKKYTIYSVEDKKSVSFGAKGMSDMRLHKSEDRKKLYLDRHRDNEDWTKSGILTAGFWSRWLLWNKPTLRESIDDVEKRFSIHIKTSWK